MTLKGLEALGQCFDLLMTLLHSMVKKSFLKICPTKFLTFMEVSRPYEAYKLVDKRQSFDFSVAHMPYVDINIPS